MFIAVLDEEPALLCPDECERAMELVAAQSERKLAFLDTFEHALVGYIVAQQLHGELVTLYYAFPGDPLSSVQPYYFSGTIQGIELATDDQGQRTQKITFSNVH